METKKFELLVYTTENIGSIIAELQDWGDVDVKRVSMIDDEGNRDVILDDIGSFTV